MHSTSTIPAVPRHPLTRQTTSGPITTRAPPGPYLEVTLAPTPHQRWSHKHCSKAKKQISIRHSALSQELAQVKCRTTSSPNSSCEQTAQQAPYCLKTDLVASQVQQLQGGSSKSRRQPRMKECNDAIDPKTFAFLHIYPINVFKFTPLY